MNGRLAAAWVLVALGGAPALASHPKVEWAAHYDGPAASEDYGYDLRIDKAGNAYVIGQSIGGKTGYDFATLKYDRHGNLLWERRYDGPASGDDAGFLIDLDPWGNVIVAGDSEGIGTGRDIAILKYDPQGNLLWERRYDGPGHDDDGTNGGRTLVVDKAGNVLVCGTSIGAGTGYDAVTLKLAPNGNLVWERRFNGAANSFDDTYAIAVDAALNVYVAGDTYNTVNGTEDFVTLKYDASGNLLWARQYDGPDRKEEVVYAIALDQAASVYVTGLSKGIATNDDFATLKYDTNGNLLWAQRLDGGSGGGDIPFAIATGPQGEVVVVGEGEDVHGFDVALAVSYDTNGATRWVNTYLDPVWLGMNSFGDVTIDAQGRAFVTGDTWAGFPTSTDSITLAYAPNGATIWERRYDDAAHAGDATFSLQLDRWGTVYLAGVTLGPGLTPDILTIRCGPEIVPAANSPMR